MSLKSRIRKLEEFRRLKLTILNGHTNEESAEKLKKFEEENPDGAPVVVITAPLILKENERKHTQNERKQPLRNP